MWVGTLSVDMQNDLSNAAHERGPGRASVAGSLGALAVLLVAVTVASYPRVAVGAAIGVVATVLLRRWYARVSAPSAPAGRLRGGTRTRDGPRGERTRTDQRDARLVNGQG